MDGGTVLSGRNVLIVEGEYFLAEDLSRALRRIGARVTGPVASVDEAREIVNSGGRIDAAVLALNLHEEEVFPLADLLEARGVPFIFATGYDREAMPARHRSAAHCTKPYDPDVLAGRLAGLFR